MSETKFQVVVIFKKILYLATSKRFHDFIAVFHVKWTNITGSKVIFVMKDVSRIQL